VQKKIENKKHLKILFFFPHNPYPPHSGAHIRCLEILRGLVKYNCEVIFLSANVTPETTWDMAGIKSLKDIGIAEVFTYQIGSFDKRIIWFLRKFYSRFHRIPKVNSLIYTPPGMRLWFKKIQKSLKPDIIWMNYSYWDALIDRFGKKDAHLIIDYLDLVSRNYKMQKGVMEHFQRHESFWEPSNDIILNEDFFSGQDYGVDPVELRIITSYDRIVAISQDETNLIKKFENNADIIYIPVTYQPVICNNSYKGSVIFVTGPNRFNLQGLFYFIDKVLPHIIQKCPDFNLWVTGSCCNEVKPVKSVSLIGFVTDLKNYYSDARFALGPVLGGTGQQIKIIEAMAHGLPVVATKYSASTSPIVHGYNGYIAGTAEEFAEYCIKLWQNPELCKEMGNAARQTIRENFSEDMLLKKISDVLNLKEC
jgi:glycosyltransferase involved in cell wall biosynthesis